MFEVMGLLPCAALYVLADFMQIKSVGEKNAVLCTTITVTSFNTIALGRKTVPRTGTGWLILVF